jgi:hypothetical protein
VALTFGRRRSRVISGVGGRRDRKGADMEDHRTDPRTDRLGVLLDQLDFAREIAQTRLEALLHLAISAFDGLHWDT